MLALSLIMFFLLHICDLQLINPKSMLSFVSEISYPSRNLFVADFFITISDTFIVKENMKYYMFSSYKSQHKLRITLIIKYVGIAIHVMYIFNFTRYL